METSETLITSLELEGQILMESCVTRGEGIPIASFESSLVSIKSGLIFSHNFSGVYSLFQPF